MVQRHLTVPYKFVCFTDSPANLNPAIEVRILPGHAKLAGWWWKPYIFKAGHFPDGDTNLFFDLDMVIVKNIDKFVSFAPDKFVGLEDVGRVFNKTYKKLGSAVLKWPANAYSNIWDTLEQNTEAAMKYHGDQDWIWNLHSTNIVFFPESWIRSYKWEIRKREELIRAGSKWIFNIVRNPDLEPETSVIAFHGTPNPEDVHDPIIVDNWQ